MNKFSVSDYDTMTKILQIVSDVFGVDASDVKSKRRLREYVKPRHCAMYNMRKMGMNWKQIGRFLGNRDHSTAIHGFNSWEGWMFYAYEKSLQKQINRKIEYEFSADIEIQKSNLMDQIKWAQANGHQFMVVPCYKMLNELNNL
jgi:hypothetical protein